MTDTVDIFNDDYTLAGQLPRAQAQAEGRWVRSAHLWILRPSAGTVLFQKRAMNRKYFPGKLDSTTAGHCSSGEDISAASREMSTELGTVVDFASLVPLGVRRNVIPTPDLTVRQFCHVYFLPDNRPVESYSPNADTCAGLVEIRVGDGEALFQRRMSVISGEWTEWPGAVKRLVDISLADFMPRPDPYYRGVFSLAGRYLNGETGLGI